MELFQRAKAVRLRSHHDKYLLAEEDEERVCQSRSGSTRRARWEVELVVDDKAQPLIRLRSCYGKYLSASNVPLLLGFTGHKVLQAAPRRLDSSLEWEPIRDGFQVKLKTRYGHFLRANGGPPPWRNSVTHDIPQVHLDWVLWEVDIVEIRTYSPAVAVAESVLAAEESSESSPSFSKQESYSSSPGVSPQKSFSSVSSSGSPHKSFSSSTRSSVSPHKSFSSSTRSRGSPHKSYSRIIHYMISNNDGFVEDGGEEFTFNFKGASVEELTQKLEEETELGDIIVCSRNPVNGNLYPLRLRLPPNKPTMNVVLVPASSKVARTFAIQETSL